MGGVVVLAAVAVIAWALMIRPARRRQVAQQRLLDSLSTGDEVLTVGGIFGIVQDTDEDENLIVEIAEGIHVRVARRAVAAVVKDDGGDDDPDDAEVVDGEATEEHDADPSQPSS
ncbi:MAG: preprotein translocase subunit YajC [Gaiellales bacterium]